MNKKYEIVTEREDKKENILENPFFDFFIDKFIFILLILMIFFWKNYGRKKIESIEKILSKQKYEKDKIKGYLYRILAISNADRVLYGEFYNGEIYASGSHKLKFGAREEAREEGISSIKELIQDIPAEKLDSETEALSKNEYLCIHKEDKENRGCKNYLEKNNLEQVMELVIRNNNGGVIGILSIQFLYLTEENNIRNINQDKIDKILAYKKRIENMIKGTQEASIFSIW